MDLLNNILGETSTRSGSGNTSRSGSSGGTIDTDGNVENTGGDYTHQSGSYSSSGGGTQTSYYDNSAEIAAQRERAAEIATQNAAIDKQAADPYRVHILSDATTGTKFILLSDGQTTWKIVGNAGASSRDPNPFDTRTVAEVLHNWLSQNYRHGWIEGRRPNTSTDTEKQAAYTTALANGKVISLSQVLQSVNPSTHVFYVPEGYFYAGDISEVPSVSQGDAADAGNRAGYGQKPYATTPAQTSDDDNALIWLLLPLAAFAAVKMKKKNNKKRKKR